ncbi:MAG: hypothetical protein WKG32_13890 [Gemmatimonadaceae bacterium]
MNEYEPPSGWAEATITDLIAEDGEFSDGDWVESKDQDPAGDVRLIQLADVGDGEYMSKSARFLTSAKARELRCTFLCRGDVLVARMPDPLGRACIFPGDPKTSVTVVDVCIVRTGPAGADHRWLMWAINSPQFRSAVAALESGTTRKRISRGNLATIRLPVPPLAEQRRIVAAIEEHLSDLDAAVAGLERARANLKRYVAATREQVIRQHPRVALGDLLAEPLCNGRSVPTAHTGFPVLRLTCLRAGRVDLVERKIGAWTASEARPHLVREGDFLIARGNGSRALVGRGGLVGPVDDPVAFPDTLIRVRPDESRITGSYLRLVWDSIGVSRQIEGFARTTAGIYKINQRDLEATMLPVPESVAQQRTIVAEVERHLTVADRTAAEIDVQLARAARLRQAILKRAFEGRLVPQDPADEPASVLLDRIRAERAAGGDGSRRGGRQRRAARKRG